jgi:3-hydroxyacyl-CoA dehydrogenase
MINEGANILQEGIAQNASDIDLVSILGYGFPRWRGGLMHYANQLGMATILAGFKNVSTEDRHLWRPSQLILDAAKKGHDFVSFKD